MNGGLQKVDSNMTDCPYVSSIKKRYVVSVLGATLLTAAICSAPDAATALTAVGQTSMLTASQQHEFMHAKNVLPLYNSKKQQQRR